MPKLEIDIEKGRFPLGPIIVSESTLELLEVEVIRNALQRHAKSDWGDDLHQADRESNDRAVDHGGKILSAYGRRNDGHRFWIITTLKDSEPSWTQVLLPSEY